MKRDPIKATVLATKIIPNVNAGMAKELGLTPDQRSLALITADCDDVTYTALDEATKKADVKWVTVEQPMRIPAWPVRSSACWQAPIRQR